VRIQVSVIAFRAAGGGFLAWIERVPDREWNPEAKRVEDAGMGVRVVDRERSFRSQTKLTMRPIQEIRRRDDQNQLSVGKNPRWPVAPVIEKTGMIEIPCLRAAGFDSTPGWLLLK
jgi:hypothetical protein